MKRLFNHRKRPYEDRIDYDEWDEYTQDTEEAEYESIEAGVDYEDAAFADEAYEDEAYEVEAYEPAEGKSAGYGAAGGYIAVESEYVPDGYVVEEAEELGFEEVVYEEDDEYESADNSYAEEEGEYEDDYYAEDDEEDSADWEDEDGYYGQPKRKKRARAGGLKMGFMDMVITGTGIVALIVAMIAGVRYMGVRAVDKQVESFVSVGSQLADVNLPGEAGLLAVADAQAAKKAAAEALAQLEKEQQEKEEQENKEYNEQDYKNMVTVGLSMSSIQQDLKIKFINKETDKLISNVPFTVTVTDPDGKTSTWTDDDMDGIIYKTKLDHGEYKVVPLEFTNDKYKDYYLPTTSKSVTVKKDIEYKKVDVKNEIKTEAEVNVTKEDTKKNETQVENKLDNTVDWVESTTKPVSYKEVDKTTIADPLTLAYTGSFLRLAQVTAPAPQPSYTISESSKSMKVGDTFTLKATVTGVEQTDIVWSSSNPTVATVVPVEGNSNEAVVTAIAAGSTAISYKVNGKTVSGGNAVTNQGATCMVTVQAAEVLTKGTVTVNKPTPSVAMGGTVAVKATAAGFTTGRELAYTAVSNKTNIATVTYDQQGNIAITGVAEGEADITVSVNYKGVSADAAASTVASTVVKVKVGPKLALTLDKATATAYIGTPLVLKATLNSTLSETVLTAISSDTSVATVAVSGKNITVTGLVVGSTTITVKYMENNHEVSAACTVTVKPDPKLDKTTKLKDVKGLQVYVEENGTYREAVYADYYTAAKFFVKGDVMYTGWQTINGRVYYFDAAGNKVTGEQVIQGAKYNFGSDGALYTGSGTRGIDVSKWNGTIDWKAVKNSGIEYVIIRCGYRGSSQGALIEDPKYKTNIKGATEAGLKVGVYFFTQAISEAEAVEEASMVLEQVKNYNISYPIFLDVEASGGRADSIDKATRTAVCKAFCQTIQSAGYTAGIYANKTWLETKMDASALGAYKIWLAQYASTPTYGGRYDMWQYQSTGKVSGISGDVDMNWSYLGY